MNRHKRLNERSKPLTNEQTTSPTNERNNRITNANSDAPRSTTSSTITCTSDAEISSSKKIFCPIQRSMMKLSKHAYRVGGQLRATNAHTSLNSRIRKKVRISNTGG
jgi:hypothetical protein